MTTTKCGNCGTTMGGIALQCHECGGRDVSVTMTSELPPLVQRPRGCQCDTCEVDEAQGLFVVNCGGTAMALANAGGTL